MTAPEMLRRYIDQAGLDDQEFASRAGVSKASVSFWLSGRIRPSGASALIIQSVTGGAVPFTAWYAAPPSRPDGTPLDGSGIARSRKSRRRHGRKVARSAA